MRWTTLFVAAALLLTAPAASANECDEPCGYIVPIIDIDFPEKMPCGGGRLIYADETPEDCLAMMANGESVTQSGTIRIYWDAQEEPTYPLGVGAEGVDEIEVSFSGTQSNPDWIEMSFDPPSYTISMTDLYDLQNNYIIEPDGNPILTFNWVRPVDVTFTRTGDPDAKWEKKIDDRNGVVANFMKARSTASGDYYREAFGVEEFRFNHYAASDVDAPSTDAPGEDAPGLAPVAILAALGVALLVRRR
ncbi:MAG: hypothetical protein ACPHID_03630 [Thermoplasmatota archaeon]